MNTQGNIAAWLLLILSAAAAGCKDKPLPFAGEDKNKLYGAALVIRDFKRWSYQKKKLYWEVTAKEAHYFSPDPKLKKKKSEKKSAESKKKKESRKLKKLKDFSELYAEDAEEQSILIRDLVEKGKPNFPVYGKSVIIDFDMNYYKNGKFQTNIIGNYGYLVNDTNDMHLEGDVVVTTVEGRKLESDYLNYDAETDRLHTMAPVHLSSEDGVLNGIGMIATSDLNWIQILAPGGFAEKKKKKN